MNNNKYLIDKKTKDEKHSTSKNTKDHNSLIKRHKSHEIYKVASRPSKKNYELKNKNELKEIIEVNINSPGKSKDITVRFLEKEKKIKTNLKSKIESSPLNSFNKTKSFGNFGKKNKKETKINSYIYSGKNQKICAFDKIKIMNDEESIIELDTEELCKLIK